ncbi:MAG TPA: maleylpyruvate isomerase family mycothiol-dependent enzyme [Acidimicrobiia bacterium]|nr:maleylpyruvate isomerase family mycothiol-dependent enzyme [Acidimicrobiia bacterium]
MSPAPTELDRVLAVESDRFREVIEYAGADRTVPTCDQWSADDLLWHLAEVQRFWAEVVGRRPAGPDSIDSPVRPGDRKQTLEFFDAAHRALRTALADAEDGEEAWTWTEDQTVGFIRRRQAHEALIHRVDAELTAGADIRSVEPRIAADGVDEILNVMIGGSPSWGEFDPEPATLGLETADFDGRWLLRFGRFRGTSPQSGNTYDLDAAVLESDTARPDCTVRAPAWTLDRWLWGRAAGDEVTIDGQASLATRLRAIATEVTQ